MCMEPQIENFMGKIKSCNMSQCPAWKENGVPVSGEMGIVTDKRGLERQMQWRYRGTNGEIWGGWKA